MATPYMGLTLPIQGVTQSPTWGNDLTQDLQVIDGHTHTGNGVDGLQLGSASLNLQSSLTLNNNALINVFSLNLFPQTVEPSGVTSSLYSNNLGDLYYIDGTGANIALTLSGSIASTPGNIGGLTAPAAVTYVSGATTFYFQQAANTAAYIDTLGVNFRNPGAFANYIQVVSPNSLSTTYTLTLPLPAITNAQPSYVSINNSGVMVAETGDFIAGNLTVNGANSVASIMDITGVSQIVGKMNTSTANFIANLMDATGANNIASKITSTGANTIRNTTTRAVSSTVGVGGVAISNSCNGFTTSSTSYVNVTNLSVTITTTGKPVQLMLISDGQAGGSYFGAVSGTAVASVQILRNGTPVGVYITQASGSSVVPASSVVTVDPVSASTYTYTVQLSTSSNPVSIQNAKLVAYELL